MSPSPYDAIALAGRTFLTLVFLTAVVGKARAWTEFQGVLGNYRLLPWALVWPASCVLVAMEFATGLGLLAARHAIWPPALAALLLVVFTIAMTINLARGRVEIDCGCFQSSLRQTLSWTLVLRNIGLICIALVLALPQTRATGASFTAWANGLAAGIGFFALYEAMNALWAVGSTSRGTRAKTAELR
jgi:hypothetical protein